MYPNCNKNVYGANIRFSKEDKEIILVLFLDIDNASAPIKTFLCISYILDNTIEYNPMYLYMEENNKKEKK